MESTGTTMSSDQNQTVSDTQPDAGAVGTNTTNNTTTNSSNTGNVTTALQDRARATIGLWAGVANQAVQQLTVKRYALPDKNVASQILMYRQLLHTKCRPGLKLSRDYQATPAQNAVLHMPWWSEGIVETKKMIISYDNLLKRLWIQGAIVHPAITNSTTIITTPPSTDDVDLVPTSFQNGLMIADTGSDIPSEHNTNIDTLLDDTGLPPTPHEYWVSRLGFQQPDPVTDFRSGGVLSLAMMVWIVESCPNVYRRYSRVPIPGDASVLPFAITCINVTDMMSKFLMLAKSTDKMDTLLSQKPFWKMFADPSSLLACQELAMDMLADVVVELYQVRDAETGGNGKVTVFDFSQILAVTERRVEYDLLGSGPTSVDELRDIHIKLKLKYNNQLQNKLNRVNSKQQELINNYHSTKKKLLNEQQQQQQQQQNHNNPSSTSTSSAASGTTSTNDETPTEQQKQQQLPSTLPVIHPQKVKDEVFKQVSGLSNAATSFTGSLLSKMKTSTTSSSSGTQNQDTTSSSSPQGKGSKRFLVNPFISSSNAIPTTTLSSVVSTTPDQTTAASTTSNAPVMDFFNDPHDVDVVTTSGTGIGPTNNTNILSANVNDNITDSNNIDFLLVGTDEWIKTELGVDPTTVNLGGNGTNFSIGGDDDEEDLI